MANTLTKNFILDFYHGKLQGDIRAVVQVIDIVSTKTRKMYIYKFIMLSYDNMS